jgi:phosphoenolpyruvate phosphomutase
MTPALAGLDGDRVGLGVGVHSGLTARLAERARLDFVWLGSLEVSASLGLPDTNLVTSVEMADLVREVRAACALPIYVDADNGYGSDDTAVRAARLFEAAGAAAMCIEDNAFPKRNSLELGGRRALLDPAEFAERLVKLRKARTGMALIARTEALVAGHGVQDAVARLRSYAESGVDALFVQVNAACRDQLAPVLHRLRGTAPFVLAPTALPETGVEEFGRLGAVAVIFANVVVRTLASALPATLATLRRTGRLADLAGAPTRDPADPLADPLADLSTGRLAGPPTAGGAAGERGRSRA